MIKLILITFISVLLSNSESSINPSFYINFKIEDFEKILKSEGITKNIEKFENGNIKEIEFFKEEIKVVEYNGETVEFPMKRNIKEFLFNKDNSKHREVIYGQDGLKGCHFKSWGYYDSGILRSFNNNTPRFDDHGKIYCEKNGVDILYYENGNIKRETFHENHTFIGQKFYHEDGTLDWEDNKGKTIYYNKDGSIKESY